MVPSNGPSAHGIGFLEVAAAIALALTLALLFWPKLVRSKMAANETVAVATMKDINQAELTYAATYPAVGFAAQIAELGGRDMACIPGAEHGCLLAEDVALAPHVSRGYTFAATGVGVGTRTAFSSSAVPVRVGESGQRSFCSTNLWLIHYRGDGRQILDGQNCETSAALR